MNKAIRRYEIQFLPQPHSYILCRPHRKPRIQTLVILILNPPRALRVHEATPAPRTPFPPKVRLLLLVVTAAVVLPADAATYTQEEASEEVAEERGPSEAVGVFAEGGGVAVFVEGGAGLDGPCAVISVLVAVCLCRWVDGRLTSSSPQRVPERNTR